MISVLETRLNVFKNRGIIKKNKKLDIKIKRQVFYILFNTVNPKISLFAPNFFIFSNKANNTIQKCGVRANIPKNDFQRSRGGKFFKKIYIDPVLYNINITSSLFFNLISISIKSRF